MGWSTLKKDDKIYLLIPYEDNGKILYRFQESQVINTHKYDWCINIRFKYTDNVGKRQRIEFCVNKYKFAINTLPVRKDTGYARDNEIEYVDIIISLDKENLKQELLKTIDKKLNKMLNEIHNIQNTYDTLIDIQLHIEKDGLK